MNLRSVLLTAVGLMAICWTDHSQATTTTVAQSTTMPTTTAAVTTAALTDTTATVTTTVSTTTTTTTMTTAANSSAISNVNSTKAALIATTAANAAVTGARAVTAAAAVASSNTTTVSPTSCWQAVVTADNSSSAVFGNDTNTCTSDNGICYVQFYTSSKTAKYGCTGSTAYSTCSSNGLTKGVNAASNVCEFCCVTANCDNVNVLSYSAAESACTKLIAQLQNGADLQRLTYAAALMASVAAAAVRLLL